ncbi:hypothetical protein TNCT_18021 [Trichonephila clavata]|uniref:Uncharacterized protein n=1 Tax=Trichonephila clavata TaxID=2740835 RepID=A0A8X6I9R6_TRICU|nr:hypothetical protein TNCT_18021 [Trichonephila clavata]
METHIMSSWSCPLGFCNPYQVRRATLKILSLKDQFEPTLKCMYLITLSNKGATHPTSSLQRNVSPHPVLPLTPSTVKILQNGVERNLIFTIQRLLQIKWGISIREREGPTKEIIVEPFSAIVPLIRKIRKDQSGSSRLSARESFQYPRKRPRTEMKKERGERNNFRHHCPVPFSNDLRFLMFMEKRRLLTKGYVFLSFTLGMR